MYYLGINNTNIIYMPGKEEVLKLVRKFVELGLRPAGKSFIKPSEVYRVLGDIDDINSVGNQLSAGHLHLLLYNLCLFIDYNHKIKYAAIEAVEIKKNPEFILLNNIFSLLIAYPTSLKKIASLDDKKTVRLFALIMQNRRAMAMHNICFLFSGWMQHFNVTKRKRQEAFRKLQQVVSDLEVKRLKEILGYSFPYMVVLSCNPSKQEMNKLNYSLMPSYYYSDEFKQFRKNILHKIIIHFRGNILPKLKKGDFDNVEAGLRGVTNVRSTIDILAFTFLFDYGILKQSHTASGRGVCQYAEMAFLINDENLFELIDKINSYILCDLDKDEQLPALLKLDAKLFHREILYLRDKFNNVLSKMIEYFLEIQAHIKEDILYIKQIIQTLENLFRSYCNFIDSDKYNSLLREKFAEQLGPSSATEELSQENPEYYYNILHRHSCIKKSIESKLHLRDFFLLLDDAESLCNSAESVLSPIVLDFTDADIGVEQKEYINTRWESLQKKVTNLFEGYKGFVRVIPTARTVEDMQKLKGRTVIFLDEIKSLVVAFLGDDKVFSNSVLYDLNMSLIIRRWLNPLYNLDKRLERYIKAFVADKESCEDDKKPRRQVTRSLEMEGGGAGGGGAGGGGSGGVSYDSGEDEDEAADAKREEKRFRKEDLKPHLLELDSKALDLIRYVLRADEDIKNSDLLAVFRLLDLKCRETSWHHIKVKGSIFEEAPIFSVAYSVHNFDTSKRLVRKIPYVKNIQNYLERIGVVKMLSLLDSHRVERTARP